LILPNTHFLRRWEDIFYGCWSPLLERLLPVVHPEDQWYFPLLVGILVSSINYPVEAPRSE
jgi:hypothetical protein